MTETTHQNPESTSPQPEVLRPLDSSKSRLAAGLLGIFLGWAGIHNFYLGYTTRGLIQLLISVLSFGLLSWAMGIWGFVEGVMYLAKSTGYTTDGYGQPLGD